MSDVVIVETRAAQTDPSVKSIETRAGLPTSTTLGRLLGLQPTDLMFYEDFIGDAGQALPAMWESSASGGGAAAGYLNGGRNGRYQLSLDAVDAAQLVYLRSNGGTRFLHTGDGLVVVLGFEWNPSGGAGGGGANTEFGIGLAADGDTLVGIGSPYVYMNVLGSNMDLLLDYDDDDAQSGTPDTLFNLTAGQLHQVIIDLRDTTAVDVWVDGTEMLSDVDMTGLPVAVQLVPFAALRKSSGVNVEAFEIDYFRVYSTNR